MSFSSASLDARLDALLDCGTRTDFGTAHASSALRVARGCIGGKPVWIAGTDQSRSRGAIGVIEAQQLAELLAAAHEAPAPVFLVLDSAGAKVDEGLAALGAFRRLFREALATRLAGVPMFALLGRACFGGSSMLATLCNARVYSHRTLLGASGPAVIQALSGSDQLDASNATAVTALMGGEARARLSEDELLCADDLEAFRSRVRELASVDMPTTLNIQALHSRLAQRLGCVVQVDAESDEGLDRMQQLVPPGYRCDARGAVVRAVASQGQGQPVFVGVLSGAPIGAVASWVLADELLQLHQKHPKAAVILVLDASGHAATRRDEELLLSEYITHFSLTAAWLAAQGHRVVLWIPGHAAGAVYVAFAAPADQVSALRSAEIRILPQAAVEQILRTPLSETNDADAWIRTGVADALLDARLASYASGV
jgi:acetyl-CoA carboxylase beta subunit